MPAWARSVLLAAIVLCTRLPFVPQQLFSFDDVNFAYAIGDFDPRISQPQPPGYPLFVLETRAMRLAGFKRAESNLIALALLGSIAAVLLLQALGDRMFGPPVGFIAALLLTFEPSFWYTTLTSAVRVQLAVGSLVIAYVCQRVAMGEARFVLWSSVALGLGAGVRQELGLVLAPLWLYSLLRARTPLRTMLLAALVLTGSVLVWLIPTMFESGGPAEYFRNLAAYGDSEAGELTSGFFGATNDSWLSALCWLAVWLFCGALLWPLALALGWRSGWGFGRAHTGFLAAWFLPPLLFAALYHVGDPGHVQSMTPVVCLWLAWIVVRAAAELAPAISAIQVALLAQWPIFLAAIPAAVMRWQNIAWVGTWILAAPLVSAGLAVLISKTRNNGAAPRGLLIALLLYPMIGLRLVLFFFPSWFYAPQSANAWEFAKAQSYAGLALQSLSQIRNTVDEDDHAIATLRELYIPGKTVVLWKEGRTTWRKAAYYLPGAEILALEPGLARRIQGPRFSTASSGTPVTVRLPEGARLLWMTDSSKPFFHSLQSALRIERRGPVYVHDLPSGHGSARIGEFALEW